MSDAIGVVLSGVTGRMGYRQHLVRSILAIREEGGVLRSDGSRVQLNPILLGRDEEKLRAIAHRHGLSHWTTNLAEALAEPGVEIYFDAQVTPLREAAVSTAMRAGKNVYMEKPTATTLAGAESLAALAQELRVKAGVVHDKLFLPGFVKLRRLIDSEFFGRVLSIRGEFGYWVFEEPWQAAQRPSWNYRAEDGGGIVVDMFCHWNYVLEGLFGKVRAVTALATTHMPHRTDEAGQGYRATADDSAYGIFELEGGAVAQINSSWCVRVNRHELVEFQVDGTLGSAVVGLRGCRIQPRAATPVARWDPDLPDPHDYPAQWLEVPDSTYENAFKKQWSDFVRHVVDDEPHPYDLEAGARGLRLAAAGLRSSAEGRRIEF